MISYDGYLQKLDEGIIRRPIAPLALVCEAPERNIITRGNSNNPPGSTSKTTVTVRDGLRRRVSICMASDDFRKRS